MRIQPNVNPFLRGLAQRQGLGGAQGQAKQAQGAANPFGAPVQNTQVAMRAAALSATGDQWNHGFDAASWPIHDQDIVAGDPNACGTTTLASILAHYGIIPDTLEAAQAVDGAVRKWGGFTAPDDIEQFAKSKGLHSEGYNNSSFKDLKGHLEAGRTVMAMVDGGGSPHWVSVIGVRKDASGKEFVTVADPATGSTREMSRADFEAMWKNPNAGLGGFVNGLLDYSNFIQVFDTKPVPAASDFDIAYTQAAADGITDITNGAFDIRDVFTKGKLGGIVSGPLGIVGGLVSTVSAIPGALGRIVEMGGDKVLDWAGEKWKAGGVGNKILGALGYVGGGILKGLGWGVKQVGNVVAKVGQAIGSGITKVGKAIGKGVEWVADKVGKAAKAVGNGIKKAAEAVGKGVKKAAEAVVDGVKSVGKAIGKGLKKIFSGW